MRIKGADVGLQILRNVPAFYFGTSPNKFFDYISGGLPVINNYPGWLAELIVKHDCGFTANPDNAVALAEALIAASEDREALQQKGKNGRALAERDFARTELSGQWRDWVMGAAKCR